MFEFLNDLGGDIAARYQTVLRDIKAKSNSFYDAYLDLQEASIKRILDDRAVNYDESRTCGYLLRSGEVAELFQDQLHVSKEVYEQIRDRVGKVNHHKHHKAKHLLADSVVAFMETFHAFMVACVQREETFDPEYFRGIYGAYERENAALLREKDAIVSELEELAKDKRLTEEQLYQYQQALQIHANAEEDLAEQNKALLQEISALKTLKLSVLDQKLNRTIYMLNDLQEYVTESRAVSLAVGYTIVGKERIGSYIDLARSEMQRPAERPSLTSDAATPVLENQSQGIPMIKKGDRREEIPYNILDATTRLSAREALSEHIGEDADPYIHSKIISVRPDEKDLKRKRIGLAVRSLALVFGTVAVVMCLLLNGWLKLSAIVVVLPVISIVLEMVCYIKNLGDISNESKWILRKAEIKVDDKNSIITVRFSLRGGRWARFPTAVFFRAAMLIDVFGLALLGAMEFVFQSTEPGAWATLTSSIMTAVALLLVIAQLMLFSKRPKPYSGKYVSFKTEKGTLVREVRKYGVDAWTLEKNG